MVVKRNVLRNFRILFPQYSYRIVSRYLSSTKVIAQSTSSDTEHRKSHFGFETVTEGEKQQKVNEVFHNVASKYDVMNDAMSGGVHRLWKDHFMMRLAPSRNTKLIDVAGGTGDIAFRFLKYIDNERYGRRGAIIDDSHIDTSDIPNSTEQPYQHTSDGSFHVTVCDISDAMLGVGKERSKALSYIKEKNISWLQANAEDLPVDDDAYDAYTIAFGIRNCTHLDKVLSEAYRVLRPGGRFMCLEFSNVKNPLLRSLYDGYSFQVIPVLGQVIAGDWKSYQYLVESIRQFPNQETFSEMINYAGFKNVTHENLLFGITAIHSGFKV